MGRRPATPEQKRRRKITQAWYHRTYYAALQELARKHPREFLVIKYDIRAKNPAPEGETP